MCNATKQPYKICNQEYPGWKMVSETMVPVQFAGDKPSRTELILFLAVHSSNYPSDVQLVSRNLCNLSKCIHTKFTFFNVYMYTFT